jgi:hypothetical protein
MAEPSPKERAETRTAEAEARKAEAEARQAELSAFIPDLSKIVRPELATHEATTIGHSRLSFGGLQALGKEVAARVIATGAKRVLVTTDKDLASADAIYRDVDSGLTSLSKAAEGVLEATKLKKEEQEQQGEEETLLPVVAAATIAASVLPQAISLLLPRRSVATGTLEVDDLAASACVTGQLIKGKIEVVDADLRTVNGDDFFEKVGDLDECRRDLVKRKIELSPDADANATSISSIDSVVMSIDTFLTAVRAAGSEGGRSRLATAALAYALHQPQGIDHVVLVKGQTGAVTELREERTFRADTFVAIADVGVTFMVMRTADGQIVDADTVSATLVAAGKVGEIPAVKVVPTTK